MTNPIILFRSSLAEEDEETIAKKYFPVFSRRCDTQEGNLVIPRYSCLPFYQELEEEVEYLGGHLVNTYQQHRYVADIKNWYQDLEEYTPKTWFHLDEVDEEGPYILKGETNSRKNLWKTHMFARDRNELISTYINLQNDSLIGQQNIVIRKFEKYITYDYNCITGQPIIKEFRFFCYKDKILCGGYYWANQPEIIEKYNPDYKKALGFIDHLTYFISPNINFYVIDVAQKTNGLFDVIELNDGCMSGLSCCNPEELYSNLYREVIK
jgi:hypothetical protein